MKNFVPTLSNLLNKENLGLYQMIKYHFGIDNGVDSDSSHNFPLGTISELFCNHFSIDIKNSNLISSSLELFIRYRIRLTKFSGSLFLFISSNFTTAASKMYVTA